MLLFPQFAKAHSLTDPSYFFVFVNLYLQKRFKILITVSLPCVKPSLKGKEELIKSPVVVSPISPIVTLVLLVFVLEYICFFFLFFRIKTMTTRIIPARSKVSRMAPIIPPIKLEGVPAVVVD
jgi:hypothetical protein